MPAPLPPTELALVEVDQEVRVLDLDLAAQLGMVNQRDIRTTIKKHIEDLKRLGKLSAVTKVSGSRGPASKAYHLNEDQASLVCILSNTPKARQVRIQVIQVFGACCRGEFTPAVPH